MSWNLFGRVNRCDLCNKQIKGSGIRWCAEHRTEKARNRWIEEYGMDGGYKQPTGMMGLPQEAIIVLLASILLVVGFIGYLIYQLVMFIEANKTSILILLSIVLIASGIAWYLFRKIFKARRPGEERRATNIPLKNKIYIFLLVALVWIMTLWLGATCFVVIYAVFAYHNNLMYIPLIIYLTIIIAIDYFALKYAKKLNKEKMDDWEKLSNVPDWVLEKMESRSSSKVNGEHYVYKKEGSLYYRKLKKK